MKIHEEHLIIMGFLFIPHLFSLQNGCAYPNGLYKMGVHTPNGHHKMIQNGYVYLQWSNGVYFYVHCLLFSTWILYKMGVHTPLVSTKWVCMVFFLHKCPHAEVLASRWQTVAKDKCWQQLFKYYHMESLVPDKKLAEIRAKACKERQNRLVSMVPDTIPITKAEPPTKVEGPTKVEPPTKVEGPTKVELPTKVERSATAKRDAGDSADAGASVAKQPKLGHGDADLAPVTPVKRKLKSDDPLLRGSPKQEKSLATRVGACRAASIFRNSTKVEGANTLMKPSQKKVKLSTETDANQCDEELQQLVPASSNQDQEAEDEEQFMNIHQFGSIWDCLGSICFCSSFSCTHVLQMVLKNVEQFSKYSGTCCIMNYMD